MQVSEWTDEMKWQAIANDKLLAFDPATLSDDMVIRGYALLKRVGLDNVMSGYFNFAK